MRGNGNGPHVPGNISLYVGASLYFNLYNNSAFAYHGLLYLGLLLDVSEKWMSRHGYRGRVRPRYGL